MNTVISIEAGRTYQSRSFPNIKRKVMLINKIGIVYYQIIDDRKPDDAFRRMAKAPISEFAKVSL